MADDVTVVSIFRLQERPMAVALCPGGLNAWAGVPLERLAAYQRRRIGVFTLFHCEVRVFWNVRLA